MATAQYTSSWIYIYNSHYAAQTTGMIDSRVTMNIDSSPICKKRSDLICMVCIS